MGGDADTVQNIFYETIFRESIRAWRTSGTENGLRKLEWHACRHSLIFIHFYPFLPLAATTSILLGLALIYVISPPQLRQQGLQSPATLKMISLIAGATGSNRRMPPA